jgi:hypothetical protein
MDAKILRAAVSAAIRVTVSTSLIGCGGSVTGENAGATGGGGKAGTATSKTAAPAYPTPAVTSGSGNTTGSAGAASTSSGKPSGGSSTEPENRGTTDGGTATNGGASSSSAGAADGGAPTTTPADSCGAIEACLDTLDGDVKLANPGSLACCRTVIDGLMELRGADTAECWVNANGRFMRSPAHQSCCSTLSAWQQPSCTPWGPPVPPELPESALLLLEAA